MRFELSLDLPEPLINELSRAAEECRLRPAAYAVQTIEAALASRRLPGVQAAAHGPRDLFHEAPKGQATHE